MKISMNITLGGVRFKNPIFTASGTFGYGDEIMDLIDVSKLGAIVTKTITLQPKRGNPPPRLAETPSGMLNAIGLQNMGVEQFLLQKAPALKKLKVPKIVSIAGESAADFAALTGRLNQEKWIAAVELNLSCPNLQKAIICRNKELVEKIIKSVKRVSRVPVIAKLSPDVEDIARLSVIAEKAGADILSLVNTFPGMAIDVKTWKPKIANIIGGVSGPAIKPLALRCVYLAARQVSLPIIAGGGIVTANDAIEFFLAGASAVSVGTGNFLKTDATLDIIQGVERYLSARHLRSVRNLVGSMKG